MGRPPSPDGPLAGIVPGNRPLFLAGGPTGGEPLAGRPDCRPIACGPGGGPLPGVLGGGPRGTSKK